MNAVRVLLVDDEFSSAEVLALVLAGEDYEVTIAADARQALARLDEADPNLLVIDFMMPGMNGAELARTIREKERFRDVPVLMISGAPESALKAYGRHYDAFLRKPFGLEQLLDVLQSLLPRDA
jgi:CheY-like chemotaxis protein